MQSVAIDQLPKEYQEQLGSPESIAQFERGQQLVRDVLERSTTDEMFRQQLLGNPRGVLATEYERAFGTSVGTFPDIRFIESDAVATYVLPPFAATDAELSDAELESVSGGVTPTVLISVSSPGCLGVSVGIALSVYLLKTYAK